jgi:Flp pilus assembly protein TadD
VEVEFRKQIANPSADPDDILLSPPLARAVAAQPPPLQGENPTVVEIELEQRNFVEILIRRSAIHLRAARLAAVKRQGGPVLANIGTTGIIAEEFELKLPSGFRAVLVPGPVHEEVPGGTYESHASYEGGTLRGTRTLVLNEPGVSAGDSRNFAVRIYRDTVRPFTIEQTNTIDVAALVANRNVEDLHQQAYQAIQDGKTQLAYALLREVVARNPAHEYGWNNLGRVLARMGKRREAAEAYRRQIEINPRERWAWSNLGMLQQSTGQHEDAVTSYRKQLEAVPRDQYATTNLGQLLLELGRGAEAEPYIRTAISMNPRNPMLHTLLGAARACQGDAAGAHAGFDAALKLSPSPSVKNNIAWLLAGCNSDLEYALGLANEAEQETQRTLESVLLTTGDWKMAITGQSFLAALYDTKAWVLYRLGRLEESEALLAEACRLSPRWEAFSHLREVRTKIGKSAGAAEAGAAAEVSRAAIRGQSPTSGQPGSADIDDEGWIPLHVPAGALRSPQSLPVDGTGAVFACIVDSSGVIVDALELEGPDAWMNKSPAEFGKLRLPASSPGHSRRRVHLVRIEWTPDGNARAKWSSSDVAIAQALLLAPEIRPEEQAVQPPSNPVEQ